MENFYSFVNFIKATISTTDPLILILSSISTGIVIGLSCVYLSRNLIFRRAQNSTSSSLVKNNDSVQSAAQSLIPTDMVKSFSSKLFENSNENQNIPSKCPFSGKALKPNKVSNSPMAALFSSPPPGQEGASANHCPLSMTFDAFEKIVADPRFSKDQKMIKAEKKSPFEQHKSKSEPKCLQDNSLSKDQQEKNEQEPQEKLPIKGNQCENETEHQENNLFEHIPGEIKRTQQRVAKEKVMSKLTEEQLNTEKETQQAQLKSIYDLLRQQENTLGIDSMDDVYAQMKMYTA